MPTYEYNCEACGHSFDELQSFSAEPLKKCPACKKPKLRRAFGTGAAVLFKGSGFYETDYRSQSYKEGKKAETEATKPKTDEPKSTESTAKAEPAPSTNGTTGKKGKAGKVK
ncbi:MAG TPA: FmdB family zinc ribbon protein [Gemmataceae bacterium]|jgi:putative FmdB family regulatory protein|nr:FmdB family zinc ribbon protein [Gemmataceae bacterium]